MELSWEDAVAEVSEAGNATTISWGGRRRRRPPVGKSYISYIVYGVSNQVCYKKNGLPRGGQVGIAQRWRWCSLLLLFERWFHRQTFPKFSRSAMVMWAMMLHQNPGAGAGANGKEKGHLGSHRKGRGGKGDSSQESQVPRGCDPFGDVNTAVLWFVMLFFKVVVLGPFWDMSWKEITQFSK